MIKRVGELLYGPHWVRPLADALQVSERTMRYWQAGERTPPPGIWVDCIALARERRDQLKMLVVELLRGD